MAKLNNVICRTCKKVIDRNTETGWINPQPKFYYHEECYNEWEKKKEKIGQNDVTIMAEDDFWFSAIGDFFEKELKIIPNWSKIKQQWDSYLRKNMTPKGIYFAVKYYYTQCNGDESKAEGGIGIVPFVYNDSKQFWSSREQRSKIICQKINDCIENSIKEPVKIVKRKVTNQPKLLNISDISGEED